ncbi:hypothetical protein LTR28_008409, partial [Elasticomyces elasticus]
MEKMDFREGADHFRKREAHNTTSDVEHLLEQLWDIDSGMMTTQQYGSWRLWAR